jgi:superoxide dismutase, Fe-Mn family
MGRVYNYLIINYRDMQMDRRSFLTYTGVLAVASQISTSSLVWAKDHGFTLPKLNYSYDSLEPIVSTETMKLHLLKHHQSYIDKLNAEISKDPKLASLSIEKILDNVSKYNSTIRDNAGGYWNHNFFWEIMSPVSSTGEPSKKFLTLVNSSFDSLEKFKNLFQESGVNVFGSGWVWLIVNSDRKLTICTTANQDNPLMNINGAKGVPILGLDVWEHAYYLQYQNRRVDYIREWWKVVNWERVSSILDSAMLNL